jgi:RimJ/RimL family protein N-acetyltransferase
MTALETDRLAIRNFHADDWCDLQEMILQYQASEYAQYDHQWPTSTDEIKGIAAWFAEGDSYLAVCLKTTGKLIGFIALNPHEEQDDVAFGLGYVFNADYHGKGYATEGCRAVLDYAFGRLGADRMSTGTAAANHPSCRLLRRLGLRETGQGKASFRKTQDGEPIEFVGLSFAISRDEWLAHRQASNHNSAPSGWRKT